MSHPIYLPFMEGWRLAMGLKPLLLPDWIEIDADFAEQLWLKQDLLAQRYDDVFVQLPGSEAAQQEVLELIVAHLLHYWPQHYQRQGEILHNCITGQSWTMTDFAEHPLDLAARLVQEDLCLMLPPEQQPDQQYILAAASVCFPSRWCLREKLGQPLAQIHQPVPGYANGLERPINHFFDRLKPDYPGYRFNWSIVDSPDLFLDQRHSQTEPNPTITPENIGEQLWLRVERQTLRRLAGSNGILFTIRTYVHPLSQFMNDPAIVHQLRTALEQIPTAMQIYKNLLPMQSALLSYLERTENQFMKIDGEDQQ
jgi:hypothetical protein